jgi:threonine dehydrogenase-like Zn-dependent dehydrogenase
VKAVTWRGVNETAVETVDDPKILNSKDIILEVGLTVTCGSDLHLLGGYIPAMRAGDVLGHEFMGTVAEVGPEVRNHKVGDRVVVCSFISCGQCWYCRNELFSLCDNGNPNPALTEGLWGYNVGGCYGYSHALGGFAGSHADYVRVPFADQGAFTIPDEVSDMRALFASDAAPTGWTGADQAEVRPGDVVAVWGAGGVGQMAARASMLLGAERVVVIDRFPNRLAQVEQHIGAETLNYEQTSVSAELREMTGGRGPDVCIEAVGMEAHSTDPSFLYDQVKQQLRLQTDRPTAVREAIHVCRKGGTVFTLGVFAGLVDKFPLGAVMNKALTLRGAQQHGHRYIPRILEGMRTGEIKTEHLATHVLPLDQGPEGYRMFKYKEDGCVRAVFQPNGRTPEPAT